MGNRAPIMLPFVLALLIALPLRANAQTSDRDEARNRPGDFVINRPASLYAKPSADAQIIRQLHPRTVVRVVEVLDQWYKVESTKGHENGFVRRSYADPPGGGGGGGWVGGGGRQRRRTGATLSRRHLPFDRSGRRARAAEYELAEAGDAPGRRRGARRRQGPERALVQDPVGNRKPPAGMDSDAGREADRGTVGAAFCFSRRPRGGFLPKTEDR
jgi:SH3 domain-containing protein